MNLTLVLSLIQERSYVIMLGKWWQVLIILITFIVGLVWLVMKATSPKAALTVAKSPLPSSWGQ